MHIFITQSIYLYIVTVTSNKKGSLEILDKNHERQELDFLSWCIVQNNKKISNDFSKTKQEAPTPPPKARIFQ